MSFKSAHIGNGGTVLTDLRPEAGEVLKLTDEVVEPGDGIGIDNESLFGKERASIDFDPFDNPSISVDTRPRFSVHEIIGGTTVRQKIGRSPRQYSMNGVCDEEVRSQISQLDKVKSGVLLSDRVDGYPRVQFTGTSTDPLEDGGAADMDTGKFLYTFNIEMVEIGEA